MSLRSFFNPKSVAIVGASRQPGKVGYEILSNMVASGFEGKIFPVNRSADVIEGLKCYPDLEAIGETPEGVSRYLLYSCSSSLFGRSRSRTG